MADKESNEALFRLRSEVEKLEMSHPELKSRLENLLERIESRFDLGIVDHRVEVLEEAKTAVRKFEAEHPTATGVLAEFLQVLNNIGV